MSRLTSFRFKGALVGVLHALVLAFLFALAFTFVSPASPAQAAPPLLQAARGVLRAPVLAAKPGSHPLPFLSAGTLDAAESALTGADTVGITGGTLGCSDRNQADDGSHRVNQDCTFRRQAEESIAVNPADANNLIAGQNDSRIGFNHCGFDYSLDSGQHWGDGLPPFFQRLNNPPAGHTILGGAGTNHTYDAASDPGVAFDSQGNAFFSCVVFDVNTAASGLLVTLSPAAAHGSFYDNVPAAGGTFVVVEDNNPGVFHDKPFIAADSFTSSPFRDNVYATWTVFRFSNACVGGFCSADIYFSRSTNHARTWSAPRKISGTSPTLCFFGNFFDPTRDPHDCDIDQGSDPIVLPNGTLVVPFNNGNTPANDPNAQQLAVRSTDGGLTWSAPTKVGDDVTVGEPQCDFGRGPEECVPGPNIRTNDFPRVAVDRSQGDTRGTVYVTWQDFRSGSEYDIQLAESRDGGVTWTTATSPVNPSTGLDHYMPAVDVSPTTGRVAVSYFRSRQPQTSAQIGTLGQDYFLAGGRGLKTPFKAVRAAPLTPSPDGNQAGFNGDYSGLVVVGNTAHPIWSDTRDAVPASVGPQGVTHDEDIFTMALEIPGS